MADAKPKVKILFIEDNNLLRSLFSELFNIDKDYDYETLSATDLKSGLEAVTNRPDAIVLDLILPYDKYTAGDGELSEKMGLSFLAEVKKNSDYKNIPVIVFSNLNDPEIQNKTRSLGAYAYLVKSATSPEQFMQVLKEALKQKNPTR
jgi:CheY-like chemotaxis protein